MTQGGGGGRRGARDLPAHTSPCGCCLLNSLSTLAKPTECKFCYNVNGQEITVVRSAYRMSGAAIHRARRAIRDRMYVAIYEDEPVPGQPRDKKFDPPGKKFDPTGLRPCRCRHWFGSPMVHRTLISLVPVWRGPFLGYRWFSFVFCLASA